MNKQDYLTLQLARLKSPEVLENRGEGLFFVFSKGGGGKFTSRMTSQNISSGDVLVFDGAAGYKLEASNAQGEFVYWKFSVCFENLLPLFGANEISLLQNITESFKATKLYPASHPLAVECQRLLTLVPSQFNLTHRGQLIMIASTILATEFKECQTQRSSSGGADDHIIQIFEKLSASDLINLSVGELADRFNCSRRHLNRLFHKHFRVSVSALRMEMRLLKAVSLLRDANVKIINVAEQCGFNHLGLFNSCFKRRFGSSPGQWRESTFQEASKPAPKSKAPKSGSGSGCPLLATGLCPMGAQTDAPPPAVMAAFAGKISDGAAILEDLKRRDLTFGAAATPSIKRNLPESRNEL